MTRQIAGEHTHTHTHTHTEHVYPVQLGRTDMVAVSCQGLQQGGICAVYLLCISTGTFDLVTREWVRVTSLDGLFCAGHTITSEGAIVVAGGHKAVSAQQQ